MKISLSKADDPRGLHVVFTCTHKEHFDARFVILRDVLENKARPNHEVLSNKDHVYRFNLARYLDKLMLAFPFAEISEGVTRRLARAEEVRLESFRVPELEIPGYTGSLYDFQKIAVAMLTDPDYAKEHGHTGVVDLLNDQMGLGKTYVALAAIAVLQAYPALIIVPNNAKYNWRDVIEENYPNLTCGVYDTQTQNPAERDWLIRQRYDLTIVNIEAIRARPIYQDPNTKRTVIDYEYANPALFDFTYEYAVLDEHHRIKTPGALVTNGFFQIDAEDWWCPMSGTPILNRIEESWTVLHKLYPEKFGTYNEFVSRIANVNGEGKVTSYKPKEMKKLREFIADRSLRRRKEQVFKDLPQVVYKPVLVQLNQEERRIYEKIEDDLLLEMSDGTVRDIMGARPKIIRMKQACFSPELFGGSQHSSKMVELKSLVEELVASGEKAIIFSQWEKACLIIKRELEKYNPAYVTGKVKTKDRYAEQNKFNNDEDCHVYIGTIDANREAINLGIATYVIFTDLGWTPAGHDQAIGRSAAGGLRGAHLPKDTVVTVIELQAEDTYEQYVEKMLGHKRAIFDRFIERDAGTNRKVERVTLADLRSSLSKRGSKKGKKSLKAKKVSVTR